ncbi:hypothetical protein [Segatella sp.]
MEQMKLRLQCNYDVSEKKADLVSGYMITAMLGFYLCNRIS